MNQTVSDQAGAEQPRLVYYEPDHDGDTADIVAAALSLRGYKITSDDSWLTEVDEPQAMVTVEGDGSLTIHDGELGTYLESVDAYPSPVTYATSLADWWDSDGSESPVIPTEEIDEGPVDIDSVRETLECGDPIDHRVEKRMLAMCDELAAARETIASIEDQYGKAAHRLSHITSLVADLSRLERGGRVGLAAVETVRALEHAVIGGAS